MIEKLIGPLDGTAALMLAAYVVGWAGLRYASDVHGFANPTFHREKLRREEDRELANVARNALAEITSDDNLRRFLQ